MSNSNVSKFRYMHLERFWSSPSTFFLTVLGAAAAFALSYFPEAVLDLGLIPNYQVAPLTITLSVAVILFVSITTKNFTSTLLVTVVGSLGLIPFGDHAFVAFAEIFILSLLITTVILSLAISKSRLMGTWNKLYYLMFLVFGVWTLQLGYYARLGNNQQKYWSEGLPVGFGGNGGFISQDIPVIDLSVFGVLFLMSTIIFFRYRGQLSLDPSRASLAYRFGVTFLFLGQVLSLVTIVLWTEVIPLETMERIAGSAVLLNPLQDLFVRQSLFPVTVAPGNMMMHALIVTGLTTSGLMLRHVGRAGSTMSGIEGDYNIVLLAAPLFTMLFIFLGSYPVQNLIYPGGLYIPAHLFVVYMTSVWSFVTLNQLIAWLLLFISSLFKK